MSSRYRRRRRELRIRTQADSHQKRFVFYGRTDTPMPARSDEATRERQRQLSIATRLVDERGGAIVLTLFDSTSDRFASWKYRPHAGRLLRAITAPQRGFDAIVVGDTLITMSASDFDYLADLCSMHGVELWCPEIGGAFKPADADHQRIMWNSYWNPSRPAPPGRGPAGASPPVGKPPPL